jgi:hypothetical protein
MVNVSKTAPAGRSTGRRFKSVMGTPRSKTPLERGSETKRL